MVGGGSRAGAGGWGLGGGGRWLTGSLARGSQEGAGGSPLQQLIGRNVRPSAVPPIFGGLVCVPGTPEEPGAKGISQTNRPASAPLNCPG